MEDINDKIEQFFDAYEKRFAEGLADQTDVEASAEAFADYIVEASPAGISGRKNDTEFRESIPKGYEFYRSIGIKKMTITQLDITPLDNLHYLVEAYWEGDYDKESGESETVEFSVIYLLQHLKDQLKIFTYIAGDEQSVLKEKGLI